MEGSATDPSGGAHAPPAAGFGPRAVTALMLLAGIVGVVVSLASWGLLELVHQIQVGAYSTLPEALGFEEGGPVWWPLPVLAVAGLIVAFAIVRLPGRGGHEPAAGLKTGATAPVELPGVVLAALATIGLGAVLGPEAPLIALGSGLGTFAVQRMRAPTGDQLPVLMAAAGSFAAVSFIFGSPLIGAVILIEATALDRRGLTIVLPVGLFAAGIGSLVSIGMGSWTGLSSRDYSLGPLSLPDFARPVFVDFVWTVPLALAVALAVFAIVELARRLQPIVMRRPFVLVPVAGMVIAGLAIAFAESTDHGAQEVLFSGQDSLPGLVSSAGAWSAGALAAVIALKSLAWAVSLSCFRGGPTFPGLYLGAAAGILLSQGVDLALTPAVAVGMGAAVAAVLRLPLSAVVLASLLVASSGAGAQPLIIVGVVVAFITSRALDRRFRPPERAAAGTAAPPAVVA